MGVGLVALVPVLALAGALLTTLGVEGEATGWMILLLAVVWILLMAWWALRAPALLSQEARGRYLTFLRHAQYRPVDRDRQADEDHRLA